MVKVSCVEEVRLGTGSTNLANLSPGGVVVCGFDGDAVAGHDFSNAAEVISGVIVIVTSFPKALTEIVALGGGTIGFPLLDDFHSVPEVDLIALKGGSCCSILGECVVNILIQ